MQSGLSRDTKCPETGLTHQQWAFLVWQIGIFEEMRDVYAEVGPQSQPHHILSAHLVMRWISSRGFSCLHLRLYP